MRIRSNKETINSMVLGHDLLTMNQWEYKIQWMKDKRQYYGQPDARKVML